MDFGARAAGWLMGGGGGVAPSTPASNWGAMGGMGQRIAAAQAAQGGGIPALDCSNVAAIRAKGIRGMTPDEARLLQQCEARGSAAQAMTMSPAAAAAMLGGGPAAPAVPAGYGVYGVNPCGIKKRRGGGCYYPSVKNGGSASCLGVYRPGQIVPCPTGAGWATKGKKGKKVAVPRAAAVAGPALVTSYRGLQYKQLANGRCQSMHGGFIHCPPPSQAKPRANACKPYGKMNCLPAGRMSVARVMKDQKMTKSQVLSAIPNVYITRISKGNKDARKALNRQKVQFVGMSGSWLVFQDAMGQQWKAQVNAKQLYV